MKFELREKKGWSYYCIPQLEDKNINHGFFTRQSPSHSLQGDEKSNFLETFNLVDLVVMKQEHGDHVHIIKDGNRPESGDGLVLIEKRIAGIVKTADCLPIIICEADYPVASIVHAGWRGTVKKISRKAVEKMALLGAKRKKMAAFLGPSINACCYEIGEDVCNMFLKEGFSQEIFRREGKSVFLSIKTANIEILRSEGIDDIFDLDLCTCCNDNLFHSYRGGEKDKRQINFVSLGV